ncbi:hypothetical protein B0H11DRAFT_2253480 [Mycena galericulata]|nr:hypothetical protein B0H11DRAFT_2253480 [Mycena galericulata]
MRHEGLLVRALVDVLLRDLVDERMLSEQGQIGAICELANVYLKGWPISDPTHRKRSWNQEHGPDFDIWSLENQNDQGQPPYLNQNPLRALASAVFNNYLAKMLEVDTEKRRNASRFRLPRPLRPHLRKRLCHRLGPWRSRVLHKIKRVRQVRDARTGLFGSERGVGQCCIYARLRLPFQHHTCLLLALSCVLTSHFDPALLPTLRPCWRRFVQRAHVPEQHPVHRATVASHFALSLLQVPSYLCSSCSPPSASAFRSPSPTHPSLSYVQLVKLLENLAKLVIPPLRVPHVGSLYYGLDPTVLGRAHAPALACPLRC